MSKLGVLESLPTPSELKQSVQELQQSVQELQSLEQLPELVADQVSQALTPFLSLRRDLQQVLQVYDLVTKAQRTSLESIAKEVSARTIKGMEQRAGVLDKTMQDLAAQVQSLKSVMDSMEASRTKLQSLPENLDSAARGAAKEIENMAKEISARTIKGIEQKAGVLDKTVQDLAGQVQSLKSVMDSMEASNTKLQSLPESLDSAARSVAKEMQSSSQSLAAIALKVRPYRWITMVQMLVSGVLGALLVAAVQVGLSRLLPPSEMRQNSDFAVKVWSKATEAERKSLQEIASRPAK